MILVWPASAARIVHPLLQQLAATPPPDSHTSIDACNLLAIDLELTGLDPARDHIVSIGWLPIRQREIVLAEAGYHLIRPPVSVGQSATIHGLHDRDLASAETLEAALTELLQRYAGYVLVAHNAPMDLTFLRKAINTTLGSAPTFASIDTLAIERRQINRNDQAVREGGFRLNACLHRHQLPLAAAHNALDDAYGCALLLLAQLAHMNGSPITLGDLQGPLARWLPLRWLHRLGLA